MEPKNKIVIVALFVAILAGIMWFLNGPNDSEVLQNPSSAQNGGICGPKAMGADYDVSYCDNSCNSDADCQHSCGCGAINKDEVCRDEGVTYDCVNHNVNCISGKCVLGEESIPAVSITTDKTEYAQGEAISIDVENGANVTVLYYGHNPLWGTEYFENNAWESLDAEGGGFQLAMGKVNDACYIQLYERMPPYKIYVGGGMLLRWNQTICPYGEGNPSKPSFVKYIEPGRYRLTFNP